MQWAVAIAYWPARLGALPGTAFALTPQHIIRFWRQEGGRFELRLGEVFFMTAGGFSADRGRFQNALIKPTQERLGHSHRQPTQLRQEIARHKHV